MSLYPGAIWRGPIPSTNYRQGRSHPVVGITIHHMVTTLGVCDQLFRQTDLGRSAHFGTGRDGTVYQWVDTDDVAYHACNANWTGYIGIENDDQGQDLPLSDAQVNAIAGIINWLGVPAVAMVNETDPGIGYHGQFPGDCGSHWGQTACPGSMVAQIPAIIAACLPHPTPPLPPGKQEVMKLVPYGANYLQFGVDANGVLLQSTIGSDLRVVEQDKKILTGNRPSGEVEVIVLADQRILIATEDPAGLNRSISYAPGSGYFDANGNPLPPL